MKRNRFHAFGAGGGVSLATVPITTVTGNTTLDTTHHTVLVDATSGAVTLTLPAVASSTRRVYNIKKIDSSVNAVVVDPAGAELIDDQSSVSIQSQWNAITLHCNGSVWYRL